MDTNHMTRGGDDGTHWAGCEHDHWDCMLVKMEKQVTELQRKLRWVPVTERLPQDGKRVLIRTQSGYLHIGRHSKVVPQWATDDGCYFHGAEYTWVISWRELEA